MTTIRLAGRTVLFSSEFGDLVIVVRTRHFSLAETPMLRDETPLTRGRRRRMSLEQNEWLDEVRGLSAVRLEVVMLDVGWYLHGVLLYGARWIIELEAPYRSWRGTVR